jgi:type I restriction enzyme R subunit
LVISDENGIIEDGDENKKEVEAYLKEIKEKYQSLLSYEKEVIDSFKHNDDGIEILIVVDKLLTGFDAPRNTVLYLAKELKDHNLLQAIARVNRLYDNPALPKTAGYIIDYSENAVNIKTAMELFGNFDENDVKGALINVKEKIEELEADYGTLHDMFKMIANDDEAYLQHLKDEPSRKEFYSALNKFLKNFNECMVLRDFVHEFDQIDMYRKEMKKFMELRKNASLRYADRIDFSQYKQALIKVMDDNIKAEEAELLTKQIVITDKEAFEKAVAEIGSDKSKAEAITAQTEKTISEVFERDPEFYSRFSQKISELLEAMRQKKLADIDALKQARLLSDQVLNKEDDSVPEAVAKTAGADILYRNVKGNFSDFGISDDQFVQIVLRLRDVLRQGAVVDWWKNMEVKRQMRNHLDDYLYDEVRGKDGIELSSEQKQEIIATVMNLAENNHDIFTL